MTLAATTNDLLLESQGWAERSTDLAEWALGRIVNRTDAWGQYLPPARRSIRTRADGSTAVDTAITAKGELTLAELTAHFRGADLGHLIGLHSTSQAQTCRWGAVDVDQHDERDEAQAAANFRYATHLLGKLEAAGITALLLDSNGRGGFHLIVLFDEPVPAARVHAWLLEKPGAMTLFRALPNEHLSLAKHLTAEIKTEEFVAGKGVVVKWERIRRQNHWFDALYNACAAGHGCGVRLVDEQVPEPPPRQRRSAREDDMPWIDPAQLLGWMRPRRW